MATREARCVHDRPRAAERGHKMGRKPHDAGPCGVEAWFETLRDLPHAAQWHILDREEPAIWRILV